MLKHSKKKFKNGASKTYEKISHTLTCMSFKFYKKKGKRTRWKKNLKK